MNSNQLAIVLIAGMIGLFVWTTSAKAKSSQQAQQEQQDSRFSMGIQGFQLAF